MFWARTVSWQIWFGLAGVFILRAADWPALFAFYDRDGITNIDNIPFGDESFNETARFKRGIFY